MLTIPNIQTKPIPGPLGISGVLNMGAAGSITDEDDTFFIGNGQMRYDAMATVVWARSDRGDFDGEGSGLQAADLTNNEWRVAQAASTPGSFTRTFDAIKVKYLHRYGYNKLIISGYAWEDNSTTGSGYTFENHIRAEINGEMQTASVTSSTASAFTIEINLASGGANLTPGNLYTVTVDLRCLTDIDFGNTGSSIARTYLREDVVIIATT